MAALRPAAPDFRVYWDNAYCEHDLYPDRREVLLNVFEELERNQNPDLVYAFCSTARLPLPVPASRPWPPPRPTSTTSSRNIATA